MKKSPAFLRDSFALSYPAGACPELFFWGGGWALFYVIITGCVVVIPAPFMRMMYWPFGMSARLNT